MNRKALFLILVALVVGIGSKGSTERKPGPQPDSKPSIQSELTEAQHRLDELLRLLEAELDRRRESHSDNLQRLAERARGEQ